MNPVFADYMQAYGEAGLEGAAARISAATGAALLVHGRVRPDRDAAGTADLWIGNSLVGGRVDLLPRGQAAASRAIRSPPRHADAIPHRPLSGDLLRNRRISISSSPRPSRISRRSIARLPACRKSRPTRCCAANGAGPSLEVRTERERAVFRARNHRAGKKKGRTLARPEFREETPRRRTAEPPEVIHTAPHKIMIAGRKSTPLENIVGSLGNFAWLGQTGSTRFVRCTNSRPLATFRRKVIRRDETAAPPRPASCPVPRPRRDLAGDRASAGARHGARRAAGSPTELGGTARWRAGGCQRQAHRRAGSPVAALAGRRRRHSWRGASCVWTAAW